MKMKGLKILPIGVAVSMFLSSMPVMALPLNTVVLGNKAFSINALVSNVPGIQTALDSAQGKLYYGINGVTNGFVSLYGNQPMTQAQKDGLHNISYIDKVGTQFVESIYQGIDSATPMPTATATAAPTATPTATATPTPTPTATATATPAPVITVNNVRVINSTSIEVTFSDGGKQTYSNLNLVPGNNNLTVVYNEKSYSVTAVCPDKAAVENIEFVNYRNIKVTFNTTVDKASAVDPRSYYFEAVDGDAKFGAALPTLQDSNSLDKIETDYPGGAAAWWHNHSNPASPVDNIVANDVNGKTVVNIYLPEDARFTNVYDDETTVDAERTLGILQQTSKKGAETLKALIKDSSVNVAVRNVKDSSGNLSIDTVVKPIKILDEVKPTISQVLKINGTGREVVTNGNIGSNLGTYNLLRTLESNNQVGEELSFVYSEPVFDAHGLDMSDLESARNVRLYVNGNIIASTSEGNLGEFLKFDMSRSSTYESSKVVVLDAEKAVLAAGGRYNELFAVNKDYNIKIIGVTDLAGNIEVSSENNLTVRFHDNSVPTPSVVVPAAVDVVQVADNILRIEFNRANAKGCLKIKNPDGEGTGEFKVDFAESKAAGNGKYYSYVAVPARDSEANGAIPQGLQQNQVLAYDKQDVIYRDISVEEIRVDSTPAGPINGNSFYKNGMELRDDIKAPEAQTPGDIRYANRGTNISIPVKDVTPWAADENITPWVAPIAYRYNSSTYRFGNEIVPDQNGKDTYLPVKVSYTDGNGAIHQAMVSNYDLRPEGTLEQDLNRGFSGSIGFANNNLVLNLANYPQLLDGSGKLVANASYKVELPKGYFTDSPKDITLNQNESDFTFNGNTFDILYVDDARDEANYRIRWPHRIIDAGLGFTSAEKTVNVKVEQKPPVPPAEQVVPQTSKQLINYDEPTNTMKIEFTGNIDVNSLKDKNNYSFDGKTLAQWDQLLGTNTTIDYVVNNANPADIHQYAVFKIPQDSIRETGDYAFIVRGVKHPNGGTMTPVETVVKLRDNYCPVVVDAAVTGDSQIKLTFNEPVRYFVDTATQADSDSAARNFKVLVGGQLWTVRSAVLPEGSTNKREVILNLGNVLPTTGNISVQIVKDQNNNILLVDMSVGKNPLKTDTYNVNRP